MELLWSLNEMIAHRANCTAAHKQVLSEGLKQIKMRHIKLKARVYSRTTAAGFSAKEALLREALSLFPPRRRGRWCSVNNQTTRKNSQCNVWASFLAQLVPNYHLIRLHTWGVTLSSTSHSLTLSWTSPLSGQSWVRAFSLFGGMKLRKGPDSWTIEHVV